MGPENVLMAPLLAHGSKFEACTVLIQWDFGWIRSCGFCLVAMEAWKIVYLGSVVA